MASVTLTESAKLAQDDLVAGVIENIITVNRFYEVLPFEGITGNALAYNRENALGDVVVAGVGTVLSSGNGKDAATFTQVTSTLTTIMGDAEVNGLVQATRSSDGNDQTAVQVSSKAKSCGRKYQDMLINGTGSTNQFAGMLSLLASGQTIDPATNGANISFELLDQLLDLVTAKDGEVDFITMHSRTLRSYMSLLRALGGASINEVVQLPSGKTVPAYRNVPIFRNDWIPTNQTHGSSSASTTVFAGCFDDGSQNVGLAGLTAESAAGIQIVDVGESETKDERITRVKWYCGLALFSEKALAGISGVNN